MDKSALRVAGLLTALAGMVITWMSYPYRPQHVPATVHTELSVKPLVTMSPPSAQETEGQSANVDPFAARGWQAPSDPVATIVVPVVSAPVLIAAPIAPPALPFQFIGRMNDNGTEVVYLSQGEQMLFARRGETLQGAFKVLQISPRQIEFLHIPTGEKLLMALPASDN